MMKKNMYIATIGLGGGTALFALATYIKKSEQQKLDRTPFIASAVEYVKSQPTVMDLLGTKYLVIGQAKLLDRLRSRTRHQAAVKIPLEGDKDKSWLWIYADRKQDQEKFKIFKMEMTFDKLKNKKLVILDLRGKLDQEHDTEEKQQQDNKMK